jgi:hypothetical protein
MTEDTETKERTVFVRIDDNEFPWTAEEMKNLVTSVDEATPDDVTVLVTSSSVKYLDSDEVKEYLDELRDQM